MIDEYKKYFSLWYIQNAIKNKKLNQKEELRQRELLMQLNKYNHLIEIITFDDIYQKMELLCNEDINKATLTKDDILVFKELYVKKMDTFFNRSTEKDKEKDTKK